MCQLVEHQYNEGFYVTSSRTIVLISKCHKTFFILRKPMKFREFFRVENMWRDTRITHVNNVM